MVASPLVSVLIPCFNAGLYLRDALDSALSQTWPSMEIIAVNDGSTDDTLSILRKYERFGVAVVNQPNLGQCASANRAFKKSNGELVKFFDADDVMSADHIERQVDKLGGRRDAVSMAEWARFYDKPSEAQFHPLTMYRDATPVDWLTTEWETAQPMMQCGIWLVPREILSRVGLWDERLSLINDFEFFSRVLLGARAIIYAPGARLYYRSGLPTSLSGRKSREAIESAFLSLMLGTQHLLKTEDSARTRRACANMLQNFEYEHYPRHPDLREKVRLRVDELGGSDIVPIGPPRFHQLRRVTGWRAARMVQRAVGQLKYLMTSMKKFSN